MSWVVYCNSHESLVLEEIFESWDEAEEQVMKHFAAEEQGFLDALVQSWPRLSPFLYRAIEELIKGLVPDFQPRPGQRGWGWECPFCRDHYWICEILD